MSRDVAISVEELSKKFGDHLVVDNASFNVPFSAVTGFVGGNGSGKTTTIRMLVGLTQPTSGTVDIVGNPYAELKDPRRVVGAVLDRLGAHPGMTGRQHLRFVAAGSPIRSTDLDATLDRVGLLDAAARRLGTYSTGMKQRLALGAALMFDPSILILDEPSNGLDPSGIAWIRELLKDFADRGGAVLVSTHQLAELAEIVDRVVVIDEGCVRADLATADLLRQTGTPRLEDAVLGLLGGGQR